MNKLNKLKKTNKLKIQKNMQNLKNMKRITAPKTKIKASQTQNMKQNSINLKAKDTKLNFLKWKSDKEKKIL